MNLESVEYFNEEFARLFDVFECEDAEGVQLYGGDWIPTSFNPEIALKYLLGDMADGEEGVIKAAPEEFIEAACDEALLPRCLDIFHVDDMIEDVEETLLFLAEDSTTAFEKAFWKVLLQREFPESEHP